MASLALSCASGVPTRTLIEAPSRPDLVAMTRRLECRFHLAQRATVDLDLGLADSTCTAGDSPKKFGSA
jgi:hypothetical protein